MEGSDARSILQSWLRHKAPTGIPEEVETAGVFPPCLGDEPLHTCLAGWWGGSHVVPSKLGLITKLKPDRSPKYRPIWDLLRSDVISTVSLTEQIVLPRLENAVEDRRHLLRVRGDMALRHTDPTIRAAVACCHQSSNAMSSVARSTWMTRSWPLEEAPAKDHASSLSRCWPSPSWASPSLETRPVSATEWFGSAPSSQSKTPV